MHEPAACGARPAQQARLHICPVASVSSGKMPASKPANKTVASVALAKRLARPALVLMNMCRNENRILPSVEAGRKQQSNLVCLNLASRIFGSWRLCVNQPFPHRRPHAKAQSRKGKPQSETLPAISVRDLFRTGRNVSRGSRSRRLT
jgi:hypothetical protein